MGSSRGRTSAAKQSQHRPLEADAQHSLLEREIGLENAMQHLRKRLSAFKHYCRHTDVLCTSTPRRQRRRTHKEKEVVRRRRGRTSTCIDDYRKMLFLQNIYFLVLHIPIRNCVCTQISSCLTTCDETFNGGGGCSHRIATSNKNPRKQLYDTTAARRAAMGKNAMRHTRYYTCECMRFVEASSA